MKKTAINRILPHLAALGIFLLLSVLYFLPQLQGKVIPQGDIISYIGMSQEVRAFEEATGEVSHWTNSMFGGMPTYQISSPVRSNMLQYVEDAANLFIGRPIGYFIAMMIGMYILLLVLGVRHWLATIGAIAFAFTTNHFILYEAGHMSKVRAIAFFAPIVAGVLLTYRGQLLTGGVLFAAALGIDIYVNHPQMTYYLGLTLLIYLGWQLVKDIRNGEMVRFAKASAILLLGTALAVGASFSKIWSTYEYAKDTMRGGPVLVNDNASAREDTGLDWDYAMQWSNSTLDLVATFIPGVVGGGSQEPVSDDSAFAKFLKARGARVPANLKAPLYWGALPFTSGPAYLGAGIFFLFILGLSILKGQLKWWAGLATLLIFLISMGKHFEVLNRLLFDYFPMYNNFRAHNSALAVAALIVPMLGIYTLSRIIQGNIPKDQTMKGLKIAGAITGAICLFFALLGPSFFDFTSPGDEQYRQAGYDIAAIISDRQSLMRMDALRSLIIIAIAAGLVWAFINEKIKKTYCLLGIGILFTLDLWTVGRRYLDSASFVSKTEYNKNFAPRPVDEQILRDTDLSYRVLDLSVNTFNSAMPSYWHKTIGGYHAAKLRRYQDLIEHHISRGNQKVLDMLNTRYIITKEEQVQQNPGALGNAWFISDFKMVNTPNEEIDALNTINPATTAVVHSEYQAYIGNLKSSPSGTITLTDYKPNRLTYKANTSSDAFVVFSEIWYGPDKGWQAYIDGKPVAHIRVDYILRGLKVPAGEHTIVFEFKPESFVRGEAISLVSSSLILLALLGMLGYRTYNWYEQLPEKEVPPAKPRRKSSRQTNRKKKR